MSDLTERLTRLIQELGDSHDVLEATERDTLAEAVTTLTEQEVAENEAKRQGFASAGSYVAHLIHTRNEERLRAEDLAEENARLREALKEADNLRFQLNWLVSRATVHGDCADAPTTFPEVEAVTHHSLTVFVERYDKARAALSDQQEGSDG